MSTANAGRWCTLGGGALGVPVAMAVAAGLVIVSAVGVELVADLTRGWLPITQRHAVYGFALVCTALSTVLLIGPVFNYVRVGQARRIEAIRTFYWPNTIAHYLEQFCATRAGVRELVAKWRQGGPSAQDELVPELHAQFDTLLEEDFGLRTYIVPSILLTLIASIVLFYGFIGGIDLARQGAAGGALEPLGIRLDLVSIAAIFGAYTWVTSDSITRNHQAAFHPSDLSWYALRLVVAVPLGQALSMASTTASTDLKSYSPGTYGALLAFVISMFSFDSLSRALAALAARAGNVPIASPDARDDLLVKLPGVDDDASRRLAAEGITTAAQIVTADPVRTSIRTNLPFEFVLGTIDAAILFAFVGTDLAVWRGYGFKGASNVLEFYDELGSRGVYEELRKQPPSAWAEELAMVEARRQQAIAAMQDADAERQEAQADQDRAAAQRALNRGKAASAARDAADTDIRMQIDALRAALINENVLLAAIAKATKVDVAGLANIIAQIARDPYAAFIRRLYTAPPPGVPEVNSEKSSPD